MSWIGIPHVQILHIWVRRRIKPIKLFLKRELASLQKINDQYPKYLLTLDEDPDADYNGIRRINVLRWLVG